MTFSHPSWGRSISFRHPYETSYRSTRPYLLALLLVVAAMVFGGLAYINRVEGHIAMQPSPPRSRIAASAAPVDQVSPIEPIAPVLQPEVEAWVAAQRSSKWGVYVEQISRPGVEVEVNARQEFELASIYKLFLLQPLANRKPFEVWQSDRIAGRTYADCTFVMLSVSDNPCAEALSEEIGYDSIHQSVQSQGYAQTYFNKSTHLGGTAADTGLLLKRLYARQGFSEPIAAHALEALAKPKYAEGIRRGCDGCTAVYNKTGDWNGFRHDAGLIEKNGETYVLVVFSKGGSWQQIADLTQLVTKSL